MNQNTLTREQIKTIADQYKYRVETFGCTQKEKADILSGICTALEVVTQNWTEAREWLFELTENI